MKEFKIVGFDAERGLLLIQDEKGVIFYATLDFFAENFTITSKDKT